MIRALRAVGRDRKAMLTELSKITEGSLLPNYPQLPRPLAKGIVSLRKELALHIERIQFFSSSLEKGVVDGFELNSELHENYKSHIKESKLIFERLDSGFFSLFDIFKQIDRDENSATNLFTQFQAIKSDLEQSSNLGMILDEQAKAILQSMQTHRLILINRQLKAIRENRELEVINSASQFALISATFLMTKDIQLNCCKIKSNNSFILGEVDNLYSSSLELSNQMKGLFKKSTNQAKIFKKVRSGFSKIEKFRGKIEVDSELLRILLEKNRDQGQQLSDTANYFKLDDNSVKIMINDLKTELVMKTKTTPETPPQGNIISLNAFKNSLSDKD